jgi:hypothetical protein
MTDLQRIKARALLSIRISQATVITAGGDDLQRPKSSAKSQCNCLRGLRFRPEGALAPAVHCGAPDHRSRNQFSSLAWQFFEVAADYRNVVTLHQRMGPLVLSDKRHLPRCTRAERRIYGIFAGSGKPATKRKLSEMRRAKNFHPEWDYVPAANRFVVAMAIGAIAGGGVVLSLVDVPTGRTSNSTDY